MLSGISATVVNSRSIGVLARSRQQQHQRKVPDVEGSCSSGGARTPAAMAFIGKGLEIPINWRVAEAGASLLLAAHQVDASL